MSPDGKIIHKEKSYDVCTFKERLREFGISYDSPFFGDQFGYYLKKVITIRYFGFIRIIRVRRHTSSNSKIR
jgi:hypothetical protein